MSISKYPKIRFKDENGNDYPDWEEKKLGEMFEIKKGIQISKKNLSLNGQKCILYGELFTRYDEIIEDVTSKTDLDVLPNSKYYDILMPSSDVTPNGLAKASCLLENDVILGGDMNILRYKDENVFPPFFSYQINYFKKKIMDVVSGTTIKHVYSKNIEKLNYEVPLCIDEQEKIASFFMLLDKRIEQQEQKIALLKDYKKAMMQKIFSQKIRFKDENGNDYPDWEEKKLGEMFEIKKGIQISKKDLSLNGQKCILYGELFTRYDEIIENVTSKTNLDILPNSKYHDILMPSSDVTPNGLAKASCLLENDIILGGDINILRYKNENVFPPFFSYQLNYFKKKIMDVVSGTTIKHVYSKNIEKLNYKLPLCIDEQEKITSFLLAIENNIKTQKEMVETLKKEKISLLNKMFV
jgi:type I restriction enzyme S subunit